MTHKVDALVIARGSWKDDRRSEGHRHNGRAERKHEKKAKRVRTDDIADTQVETTSGWTPVAKKCAHANTQVGLNLYGMEVDLAAVQE
jgi:hypothetical protein